MGFQLLGVLADILVLPDLACLVELVAPPPHRPLIHPEHPCNFVVIELGDLEQSRENGSVVVG